ncbi:unnamed protein product, partial [Mycena citricolor]
RPSCSTTLCLSLSAFSSFLLLSDRHGIGTERRQHLRDALRRSGSFIRIVWRSAAPPRPLWRSSLMSAD